MHPLKLVEHMKKNAERMSQGVLQKIRRSDKCRDLVVKVPEEEHRRYALDIYDDLTDWLASETDESMEERYIALGMRRAEEGVPPSDLWWAVCISRDYLWDYIQRECLLDEPVNFWGGVMLLRSLNQFFDRVTYLALCGYQKSATQVGAAARGISA
jgi:hypothetical protein